MDNIGNYFVWMPYLLIGFIIGMAAKSEGYNKLTRLICFLFWPVVILGGIISCIVLGIIELFKD